MATDQPDFIWGYLPFWIVNYGLALVTWCCVGRFFLFFFVVGRQPRNYIWRSFVALTDWWVRPVAYVTPRLVHPLYMPLIAAFWMYTIRVALFLALRLWGMTPTFPGLVPP